MCTSPLFRFNTSKYDYFRTDTYGQVRYPLFIGKYSCFQSFFPGSWEDMLIRGVYQRIPCGQCLECKINLSKQWADRCTLEAMSYRPDQCTFITLTIDQDHLFSEFISDCIDLESGEIFHVPEVQKRPLQLFLKRVRAAFPDNKLRFFGCGEYGSKNYRPHYHLLLYGLDFHDLKPLEDSVAGISGDSLYQSDTLDKLWNKGMAAVAPFSWASAAYVARYTTKKLYSKEEREARDRIIVYDGIEFQNSVDFQRYLTSGEVVRAEYKTQNSFERYKLVHTHQFTSPFIQMSRRPGIGSEAYSEALYEHDSICIPNGYKSHVSKPFRYFDKKLKDERPDLYNEVHESRARFSLEQELLEIYSSDEPYDDRLARKSDQLKRKLSVLRRSL